MIRYAFVMTDAEGRETRWERYVPSTSLYDLWRAEDSAIRGFIATFGTEPTTVRRIHW